LAQRKRIGSRLSEIEYSPPQKSNRDNSKTIWDHQPQPDQFLHSYPALNP